MDQAGRPEKILIIDDEQSILDGCRQALEKLGHEVLTAADGEEGLRLARTERPALAFVDLKMPRLSGMEVIDILAKDIPDLIIIVITGYASIMSAVESLKKGAYDYMPKPFAPDQLRAVARRALDHRNLLIEARRLKQERKEIERNFITFVTHEMRSPLAAIQQNFEALTMVLGDSLTDEASEIIERCRRRIQNLEDLIEHWLDIRRIENGTFVKEREELLLDEVIQRAVEEMSQLCHNRDLTLETNLAENLPAVMGDRESLVRVFINIIGNATKYTPAGGAITISTDYNDSYVKAMVSDTGKGIPRGKIPFLFVPFYRADGNDNQERTRGSGLGLTFCKRIMDAHDGKITVESKEGSGTTFTLHFPRSTPREGE